MKTQQAILLKDFGGPENFYLGTAEKPVPKDHEILVKVHATALNRADTLQRKGQYPPPQGESSILGLEMAGEVAEIGKKVSQWKKRDKVCGLLGGGGYAEYAVLHEDMAMQIPDNLTFVEAAAIPEVFLTAYQALVWLAKLQAGEKVLFHAGASGVGTAGIQLIKALQAEVIVTASAAKHDICLELGASQAIDYKTEDFAEVIKKYTDGKGVNVIVDFIAAPYFQDNLDSLAMDGRMVLLALMGGVLPEKVNLVPLLQKRLNIMGSTLRSRSLDYKIRLTQDMWQFSESLFQNGQLRPVIDTVFPWTEVAKAHEMMDNNENQGKIVLEVG